MTLVFSWQIFEKMLQYQIFMKIHPVEPCCSMRTDRHDEANSRFSKFCESV